MELKGNHFRIRKLTSGMIMVILTCWIIPYFVLSGILITAYTRRNDRQIEQNITSSCENGGALVADHLNTVIDKSRQATYDGVIRASYESWLKHGDESAMYREITSYLSSTYKFSKIISNAILIFRTPMTMEYYTYSNAAGATYAGIEEFQNTARQAVLAAARELDTRIVFIGVSGHLYAVRNLVLNNYEPFATLVLEVNADRVFESMNSVLWQTQGEVWLDGEPIGSYPKDRPQTEEEQSESGSTDSAPQDMPSISEEELAGMSEGGMSVVMSQDRSSACMVMKYNYQYFYFFGSLDRSRMFSDQRSYLSIYLLVCVMLIPLFVATVWYFFRNITVPVRKLMTGTDKIRAGEYGWRVESFDGNEEMGHLVDNFNHMAGRLEESFNRIYVEEIAGRDATLKALQSQINPHFLNNTLEIINWKARMNGNEEVSEMISALSTMMNATLNRNDEMFITLREELRYVDAYLYIIRQRFGEKFVFEEQTDESLMDILVPRLIIQPLVENAVEHGMPHSGERCGSLRIYMEPDEEGTGSVLVIRVENNGELTQKDRERIRELLSEEVHVGENPDRTGIGIRNVHLRLRILYGPKSGLRIFDENGMTVSELRILQASTDKTAQAQTNLPASSDNPKQTQDKHVHSSSPSAAV